MFFPAFEEAKISLRRDLDYVINGKIMFVGTNILGDFPFSPQEPF